MPRDVYPLKKGEPVVVLKMTDEQEIFTGVQVISERKDDKSWIKRTFGPTGCMLLSKYDVPRRFMVVEGWATGVAACQIFPTISDVIVAFGSSNMDLVAELWERRYPKTDIYVVPDDKENRDLWDYANDPALAGKLARIQEAVAKESRSAKAS